MSNPKRHHFDAEMLQSRFTDEKGRLYFYDKRFPEKGVQRSTPENLFVVKHLHTQHLDSGEKDFSIEEELSILEGKANKVIEKIVEKARSGKVPYLTSRERETFDKFFYFQWKRVPDFLNEKFPDHKIEKVILDRIERRKAAGAELSPELQNTENASRTMSRIIHNVKAMAIGDSRGPVYEESLRRLAAMGLLIIYAPNDSFVLGSRPILERRYPEDSSDSDPGLFLLPLASNVAVQLYGSRGEVTLEIEERSNLIWEINKAIMEQSTVIAGCSHKLIAALAGVR